MRLIALRGATTVNDNEAEAILNLDRPEVEAYGKTIPLQADMLLKADVILEKRSFMSWLLDPLLSVRM